MAAAPSRPQAARQKHTVCDMVEPGVGQKRSTIAQLVGQLEQRRARLAKPRAALLELWLVRLHHRHAAWRHRAAVVALDRPLDHRPDAPHAPRAAQLCQKRADLLWRRRGDVTRWIVDCTRQLEH